VPRRSEPTALRVAFAGTPDFSVPALRAIAASRHALVGVLTQPDRPKGRGRQLAASPVRQAALELGVPVDQPTTLKSADGRAALASWNADVLVVVAYGLILPPAALAIPRLGCVNIHGSLLPRWRGAAPIQRAILAGDAETGVTIMQMDAGLDTGPMLLARRVPIGPTTTAGELHDTLATLGAAAIVESLDAIAAGAAQPVPQPAEGATYAAKLDKAEALVDWRDSAVAIGRKVRAFDPWPVAETRLDGEQLRLYAAQPAEAPQASESLEPGTVLGLAGDAMLVQCGDGVLAVAGVQRPGGRRVTARQLANSRPLAGRRLG
jgi:methionyl-tRNA formyltransferase